MHVLKNSIVFLIREAAPSDVPTMSGIHPIREDRSTHTSRGGAETQQEGIESSPGPGSLTFSGGGDWAGHTDELRIMALVHPD
jgi:hypothetical protein